MGTTNPRCKRREDENIFRRNLSMTRVIGQRKKFVITRSLIRVGSRREDKGKEENENGMGKK